ncbi:MAG: hypothetical protein ACI4MN_05550 [Candidatus Coproplasma sp.]
MNKFTKLLSVFVIAGAVGTGVAGLAGCGGGEQPHVHSGTKHEAVAATCTQPGNIEYYTCDSADCEGKYFSDAACTIEITLADITIAALGHTATKTEATEATCTEDGNPAYYTCSGSECAGKYYSDEACTQEITDIVIEATGHTYVYTDNEDGSTHSVTCAHDDLTATNEAHVDADHDTKCDDCGATVAGTYVAEVPATCASAGTAAHYIKGDGSDGKYYSDVNCTTEVTAESLVIAKLEHTYGEFAADSQVATHSKVCAECGDKVTEDCVDENNDGKCDVCGGDVSFLKATAIPAGSYYNSVYQYEIIVAEDGTVSYNYYGTAMTDVSVTEFAVDAETGLPTATLSYKQYGYDYSRTVQIVRGGITLNGTFLPLMPAPIVEYKDAFEGVYAGELILSEDSQGNVEKITEFSITADGYVVYTTVTVDKDGKVINSLTDSLNGADNDVKYNDFKVSSYHFVAVEVDADDMVTKIELTYNGKSATFTYKEGYNGESVELPTMPVEDYTLFKDAEGTNTLAISSYSTNPMYGVSFNGHDVKVIAGNLTDGFIGYVYYYDSVAGETVEKNIILKFNAELTAVEVLEIDGTTSLASLTISPVTYTKLVADGETANNNAVVDPFNTNYAYYEIETTGWYKITAGANDLTIYTDVKDHVVSYSATLSVKAGKTKAIELTAGQYIAVYADYKAYEFTATYSVDEPEPDYILVADGKAEITSFEGADVYYVKATVENAGKYYVSVSNTDYDDKGPYFIVNDTKYGYTYNNDTWKYSLLETGEVAEVTLEDGATLIITVGCDNSYLNLTKVVVTFETEEQYQARLTAETTAPVYEGDQLGDYKYSSDTYTVAADSISLNGTALTFVKQKNGNYYYTSDTASYTFSFVDGKLSVKTGGNEYTAVKTVAVTFTEAQQGTYVYSYTNWWDETVSITYTITANSVSVNSDYASGELLCIGYDSTTGVYTYQKGNSTMTFSFNAAGNMAVATDDINWMGSYVAEKQASSGGSEEGSEDESTLALGENTIPNPDPDNEFTGSATFKAEEAGDYKFEFVNVYYSSSGSSTTVNGQTVTIAMDGTGSITVTLTAGQEIEIVVDQPMSGTVTLTITKEASSETPTTPVAVVGENTVQAGMAGYVEVTFSVAGTYTISYDSSEGNVYGIMVGDITVANGGKFTVTESVTIKVYANDNSTTSTFTIEVAKAEEESGSVNKVENGGNLALGDNEITTYDDYNATVYLVASDTLPAGTYTLTFTNLWSMSLSIDGNKVQEDGSNVTTDVTLNAGSTVSIAFIMGDDNVTVNVAAKADSEESGTESSGTESSGTESSGTESSNTEETSNDNQVDVD